MQDISTREQLTELREAFEGCDANGDGWITAAEFGSLLRTLDHDLSADECLLSFELTDSDGDGIISFEEFMNWWAGD